MSEQKKQENREKFVLEIEPVKFEADAQVKILTSNDLCGYVSELFHTVFADFEGCKFEMSQGIPSIILVFNHCKHEEGKNYAVEMAGGKKIGNSIIDKTRAYDRLVQEGDRYHITEDGADIIKELLMPRHFTNNGKVNWGNIVADYVDAPNYYAPQAGVQYTKISGIDPKAICRLIYGKKEGDSYIDYAVEVKSDLSVRNGFGTTNSNYALYITRAYNEQVKKTYEKLGFGTFGSSIIR